MPSVRAAWQDGASVHLATDEGIAGSSDGTTWRRELTVGPAGQGTSFNVADVLVFEDRTLVVGSVYVQDQPRPSAGTATTEPWAGEGSVLEPEAPGYHPAVRSSIDHGAHWSRVRSESFEPDADINAVADTPKGVVAIGALRPNGASGPFVAAAWVSPDRGTTWSAVDLRDAGWAQDSSLSAIAVIGDVIVTSGRDAHGGGIRSTRDLLQWDEAGAGVPYPVTLASDGRRLVAVASELPYDRPPDAPIVWTTTEIGRWDAVTPDASTFGDGGPGRYSYLGGTTSLTIERAGRHFVVTGSVQERSDPQFCFQDLASCQKQASIVATSDDGATWARVAAEEQRSTDESIAFATYVKGSQPAALVAVHTTSTAASTPSAGRPPAASARTSELQLWRWSNDGAPAPMASSTPTTTTPLRPLLDPKGDLAVGASARLQWFTGGCGGDGMSVGGRLYTVTGARLPPPQPNWPVRKLQIADGPSLMVLGTVTRVGPDELSFTVEGTDATVRLTPAASPSFGCG